MQKLWQSKKSSGRSISFKIMVLYFIFVLVLGVSYAYFSTTLRITGIASIDGVAQEWPDGVLPSTPVVVESGTQFSGSFQSQYLSGNAISTTAQNKFSSVVENYDTSTSTYTITIVKTATNGNSDKPTENFSLDFQIQNSSNITWTSGEVTNTYSSNGNFLSNVTGEIDKTTLASGDTATLNMQFTLVICGKNRGTLYNEEITYTVNYLVGTEVRSFIVVIKFNSV